MNNLEKCPFCGGEATLVKHHDYYDKKWFSVRCNSCFAHTDEYADESRASEMWNRRPQVDNPTADMLPHIQRLRIMQGQYSHMRRNDAKWEAIEAAIEALSRPQLDNPALTLEELRGMDGEPVWVQDLLIPGCSSWHLVLEGDNEVRLFDQYAAESRTVGYSATTGHEYGKTWLAYRHKPEGANGTQNK